MCNKRNPDFTSDLDQLSIEDTCYLNKNSKKEDTYITAFQKMYGSDKTKEKRPVISKKSDILCITNRKLCKEGFLKRIEKIAAAKPKAIVLREKDLAEEEYKALAEKVIHICKNYGVPCVLHSFTKVAISLNVNAIHMPLPLLRKMTLQEKRHFEVIGASCHSSEEAKEAEKLGCTYITAGHIFLTDCKKGLPGRGLTFLEQICDRSNIPVYAIGGISSTNIESVWNAGVSGACMMSGLMTCINVKETLAGLERQ